MEKEQRQSKDKNIVPWSWRIVSIIWMIGFYFIATFWAAEQKSPWPLIYTIIIGLSLGALIAIAGIRAARKPPSKPIEGTPTALRLLSTRLNCL